MFRWHEVLIDKDLPVRRCEGHNVVAWMPDDVGDIWIVVSTSLTTANTLA